MGEDCIETRYPNVVSYAIRRCEFDDFLVRRAGIRLMEDTPLTSLRRRGDVWIANDQIETPVVIGAGGHFCPVARHLQGDRDAVKPVIAKEAEFRLAGRRTSVESDIPELFFCRDLDGYGWCVRKDDYVNVGIGRRPGADFGVHVRDFLSFLAGSGRTPNESTLQLRGHAYYAMGTGVRPLVGPGVLIAGDAAGLAYPESGEGIRPAIEAGRLAAETLIAADGSYGIDALQPYATELRRLHRPVTPTPAPLRPAVTILGRALMHSAAFTRHVVINRWFLRA